MCMRDLACCAGTMASYSTLSDLVRVALANGGSINGELAGGMVMSLMTLRDSGIVVAVLSNIAHANTSAPAGRSETCSDTCAMRHSRHPVHDWNHIGGPRAVGPAPGEALAAFT